MGDLLVYNEGQMTGVLLTTVRRESDNRFEIVYIAASGEWFMPDHEDAGDDGYVHMAQIEGSCHYTISQPGTAELALARLGRWQNDQTLLRAEFSLEDQTHTYSDPLSDEQLRLSLSQAALDSPSTH